MSRETALKNAINRTTSFHDIPPIEDSSNFSSLLVFNPHSYFKVIINGTSSSKKFTAILDILDGDIFTVDLKGTDEKIKFKTCFDPDNNKQILFISGITLIETLTVEYFDYFEINTKYNAETLETITDCKEGEEYSGTRIYHLKPITTSALSVRNALNVPSVSTNDMINVKKIKMGPWEFTYDNEFSVSINHNPKSQDNLGDENG